MDENLIEDLARACESTDATPLCRVPPGRPDFISRVMDAGVMGVIVPHVKTPEEVRSIVSCVKYPPLGHRELAMSTRTSGYGGIGVKDYLSPGKFRDYDYSHD